MIRSVAHGTIDFVLCVPAELPVLDDIRVDLVPGAGLLDHGLKFAISIVLLGVVRLTVKHLGYQVEDNGLHLG